MQMSSQRKDAWIPVGLDSQVAPESSNPVFVQGYSLAMWRGEARSDGSLPPVNVWEDRCPHRGMRLSHGFVRGETLCCIYHGWGYQSGDGQCVHIPAHPDLTPPKTIHAKTFPTESRYGIVWTNLVDAPITTLSEAGADKAWLPIRSIYIQKPRTSVEAFLGQYDFGPGAQTRELDSGIWLMEEPPAVTLMLALQAVDDEKTGIHVVAAGEGLDEAGRQVLAAQQVALRDALNAF